MTKLVALTEESYAYVDTSDPEKQRDELIAAGFVAWLIHIRDG